MKIEHRDRDDRSSCETGKLLPLCDVPLGASVEVAGLSAKGPLRRRLLDLGLVPGTRAIPRLHSLLGGPTAYEFRGTLVALRRKDARAVLVSYAGGREEPARQWHTSRLMAEEEGKEKTNGSDP